MIFAAKNEDGIPTWQLIQEGKKTVTRRLKPLPVGKEFAIQPGRGKFAVCRAKVISCEQIFDWASRVSGKHNIKQFKNFLNKEAKREGFNSWHSLCKWFENKKIDMTDCYRIEFRLLKGG